MTTNNYEIEYPQKNDKIVGFLNKIYDMKKDEFSDQLWHAATIEGYETAKGMEVPEIKHELSTRGCLAVSMEWGNHLIGPYDMPDGSRAEYQRKMIGAFKQGLTGNFFKRLTESQTAKYGKVL